LAEDVTYMCGDNAGKMRNLPRFLFAYLWLLACSNDPTGLQGDERGLILYSKESTHASAEIWLVRPDGSDARRLTSNAVWDGHAHWSPDGRRIVFASESDSNPGWPFRRSEIHVMNADGSNVQKLTTGLDGSSNPRWSPDGTRIVFNRRGDDPRVRIYVMNADGSNLRPVTPPEGGDYLPDWSPDGTRVLYISSQPPTYREQMHVVNVDGTEIQMLGGDAACAGQARDARWSPDGARIAYSCETTAGKAIYTMKADGSDVVRLSPPNAPGAPTYDSAPAWSPDGRQVAFSSPRNVQVDMYIMSATGENATRLTTDDLIDVVSDWNRPR
jgi:TolB protein